ncbi:HDIG domain-containing protein [Desulfonatronum zhilinae]|nr:HDIG domain-containing protein [Desulfonatronum zhilinae]
MIENQYLHIPPLLLVISEQKFDFDIYLFQDNNYILYATPKNFTEKHLERLIENGIGNIYIDNKDKLTYEAFVQRNLPVILDSQNISLYDKAEILYDHSLIVVENFLNQINKDYPNSESYDKLVHIVDNIYTLFDNNQGAIQSIRNLIATNYKEYIHCINTSLYSISLLMHHHREQSDSQILRKSTVRQIGVGALLHDIGKSKIRQSILEKPGVLTPKEFEEVKKHPIHGVEMCQYMDLEQSVAQCVLFHHEKLDGSGYPTGTRNIPRHVQVITVADMFDAITCERPYRKHKVTTFDALKILSKEVERGRLDQELVASFIRMISQDAIRL